MSMAPRESRISSTGRRGSTSQLLEQAKSEEDCCTPRKVPKRSRVSKITRKLYEAPKCKTLLSNARTIASSFKIDANNNELSSTYENKRVPNLEEPDYPAPVKNNSFEINQLAFAIHSPDTTVVPFSVASGVSRSSSPVPIEDNGDYTVNAAARGNVEGLQHGSLLLKTTGPSSKPQINSSTGAFTEQCRGDCETCNGIVIADKQNQNASQLLTSRYERKSQKSAGRVCTQKPHQNLSKVQLQRRLLANARERSRVHALSSAFHCLRRVIPSYSPEQKLSKLTILRVAIHYINALESLVNCDGSYQAKLNFAESVDECTTVLRTEYGRSRSKSGD